MPAVTVCIPGYRSASFIGQTLASVQRQTFTDYRVLLALEPDGAQDTVNAAAGWLADERFAHYINDRTLGYAGNVGALLRRVDTPFFTVLPHDDMWHPRYLEDLLARLGSRPDASAAYADMYSFHNGSGFRSFNLADGPLFERLFSFFIEGAEGTPWRGVTRREALDRPFPANRFDDFAVECEWSLHLLSRGTVLRVSEPLYLKRQPKVDDTANVSIGWRFRMAQSQLRGALDHHRQELRALVGAQELALDEYRQVELALEAAMTKRWVVFSNGRFDFGPSEHERIAALESACRGDPNPRARAIMSVLQTALARYEMQRGRLPEALRQANAAVESAPGHGEAHRLLVEVLLSAGRVTEAIPALRRAAELMPLASGLSGLDAECARQLSSAEANDPPVAA